MVVGYFSQIGRGHPHATGTRRSIAQRLKAPGVEWAITIWQCIGRMAWDTHVSGLGVHQACHGLSIDSHTDADARAHCDVANRRNFTVATQAEL